MSDRDDHKEIINITVADFEAGVRLDKFLADHQKLQLTRSRIQNLITDKKISVNGELTVAKYKVSAGDSIEITIPPKESSYLKPEDLPLEIVYQDEYLAVVNKPAGMVTHPAPGNRSGTLVNALVFHLRSLAETAGSDRPGIVHRLDKNTSGLLVIARDDQTYLALQKGIQQRKVKRIYTALIYGHMKDEQGLIDRPIGRSHRDRKKMAIDGSTGKPAQTEYKLLKRYRLFDLLELNLLTGRTHQIRVHLSHLSHPVFGDPEYGGREKKYRTLFGPDRPLVRQMLDLMNRQALHAGKLEFYHPVSGQLLSFEAGIPEDFRAVLDVLEASQQG